VHIKTYFKAELDVETAVCGTTVLGAKAVTADVAHTAASARVNFMIVVEYIAKENYVARNPSKCECVFYSSWNLYPY